MKKPTMQNRLHQARKTYKAQQRKIKINAAKRAEVARLVEESKK